jgi:hypothetical protein
VLYLVAVRSLNYRRGDPFSYRTLLWETPDRGSFTRIFDVSILISSLSGEPN